MRLLSQEEKVDPGTRPITPVVRQSQCHVTLPFLMRDMLPYRALRGEVGGGSTGGWRTNYALERDNEGIYSLVVILSMRRLISDGPTYSSNESVEHIFLENQREPLLT